MFCSCTAYNELGGLREAPSKLNGFLQPEGGTAVITGSTTIDTIEIINYARLRARSLQCYFQFYEDEELHQMGLLSKGVSANPYMQRLMSR
ncbi:unnamed protein product [Anisakis simplex]|uniref:Oxidoreductase n=1 Tax=Anisakis simplex TaxID=6269 RepID=A0A0M3J3Z2_ANISI|nr:unnamed protein product [Anisakis simplex]